MRITKRKAIIENYKLMIVDDDEGIIDSISSFLERNGYDIHGITSPLEGLEELKRNKYDLLVLDYFMSPIKGDEFVAKLREFDREIYVMLLTGHKDLAPPLSTIKAFDIQAYCEKSSRLDQLLLLIESGIKSIGQMRSIKKYRNGLSGILEAMPKIYQLKPVELIFDDVLSQIMTQIEGEDAFIFADGLAGNGKLPVQSIYRGAGIYNVSPQDFLSKFAPALKEITENCRSTREAVVTDAGTALPLISINGEMLGTIYVKEKVGGDNIKLLEIIASQAAGAVQNTYLHSVLDRQAEDLAQAYSALKTSYFETIEVLRLAVDAKDVYTRGHSDRVSMYAELIGKRLDLSAEEVEILRIGGIFHDIGKIGVNDQILLKDSRLTDEEFAEIKKHPEKGASILSSASAFASITPLVRSHHERYDGRGYPDKLAGEAIPLCARILCVADAYDAMMSDRKYRAKLTAAAAREQLELGRGTQFDAKIIDCFLNILDESPQEIDKILKFI